MPLGRIDRIADVADNADELHKPADRLSARIHVRCEGNRLEVRARCVARFTLMISRRLFDVGKPIEVVTNGRMSFRGMVEPDPAFVLEETARADDRRMVFWGRIQVDLGSGEGATGEEEGF